MKSLSQIKLHFMKCMVKNGNLYRSEKLFKQILINLYILNKIKGLLHVQTAVNNSKVFFALRRYYLGGASYFVPVVITNGSEERNAIKSLLKSSLKRGQSIIVTLVTEIELVKNLKGETIKNKNEFNLKVIKGIPYTRFLKRIK